MPRESELKVFLAGRVAVDAGGVLLGEERFPGRQGRLLFAYLVAEQGRPVPRDELAEALWGEAPPATWEKALTVLVSKLRGLLVECDLDGAMALTSAFGAYRLNLPEGIWVDVIAAADSVAEAEEALAADDLEHAKEVATQGASLARPSFLSGEEGDWVDAKRRELSDILRRALSCLAEACLRSGDAAGAAHWAEETIDLEPYRETGYRQLMAAHAAAGNRAEALRVYERCRQLLETELGAYPSPETESIYRELLEAPAHEPRTVGPEAAPVPVIEWERLPTETPAPTAAPKHRRRTIVIGALAGIIAAAVAIPLFVLSGGPSRVDLGETPGNIVGVLDAGSGAATDAVELPAPPTAVAAGRGLVWAASADANVVYAIDPATNTRRDTIEVGNAPGGIAVGGGYVWVTNSLARTVSQIDPRALIVLQSIPVGNGPTGVDVDEAGHVWVANTTDHTVSKIRASDGKRETYSTVTDPGAIAVGEGAVWVASKSNGTVLKMNPRDGQPLKTISVGQGPAAVAVGLGSVWVANSGDGTVSQIDPDTSTVRDTIRVGAGPSGITIVRDEVWTANELAGTVSRIDPATPNDATTVSLESRPSAVAAGDGTAYVALRPNGTAHRGGTLRVAVPAVEPFATLDPAVVYVGDIGRLVPLTNDGLLTYRHVGGPAGNQLVPDLALEMPEVTADGKTYTFQLRPNIHYSNGRVVKASDFRYAIERVFKLRLRGLDITGGLSVAKEYFRSILGADRCSRRRCDLAAGIVTNDSARTIRFQLSAPDANFVYKLATTFAAVVPAGTSLQEAKRRPLPATGPYRIASFAPNRSVRLVRNPRFREWLKAAQPAGLPEEIVVKVVPALKERIALVKQGKADLTSSRTLHSFPIPPALKPWVHSHPQPVTSYLAFNTNRPPFDDLRARQAVNYALDREKVVRLVGGELTARPTCQVLPPNFAGYRRYCPYTADPSADGGWIAPDRVRAAQLVADSGTARAAVTLWIPSLTGIGLGRYLADLLESLDYRVQLRASFRRRGTNPADAYFGRLAVTKPRALPHILWSGWAADYPAASNFIEPLFSCGLQENQADFCDRALDRKIGRALKVQQTDLPGANRLWTELDREITDKALWVPLSNGYEADLVSRRVGNYQHNPRWGALLSQLWVR